MRKQINRIKKKLLVSIIVVMFSQFSFGQLWYYANTDVTHIKNLGEQIVLLTLQATENAFMEKELNKAVSKLRDELDRNYGPSPYDRNSEFIQGSVLRALNVVAAEMLLMRSSNNRVAYFPQTKQDYLQEISNTSLNLAWLQYKNDNQIRNADRQHIHRIRREIMKEYSKNEKRGRSLLMITAAFYMAQNVDEVFLALQAMEIIN
ncbi:hypothetical protein [Ascidiimonas sp. W6]|uniref:hypothetical protein n=1 Tax=Ascidiimonas meishanensis TaxID=3128903 RepID=UPI0030EC3C48